VKGLPKDLAPFDW